MEYNLTLNAHDSNINSSPIEESKCEYSYYILQYLKQRTNLVCITHLVHPSSLFLARSKHDVSARRWASKLRPLLVLGKIRIRSSTAFKVVAL